jgi:TRAP-type C4-dicarboxylate transport system permease large subunit
MEAEKCVPPKSTTKTCISFLFLSILYAIATAVESFKIKKGRFCVAAFFFRKIFPKYFYASLFSDEFLPLITRSTLNPANLTESLMAILCESPKFGGTVITTSFVVQDVSACIKTWGKKKVIIFLRKILLFFFLVNKSRTKTREKIQHKMVLRYFTPAKISFASMVCFFWFMSIIS